MAVAERTQSSAAPVPAIRHPLERLRGTIRRYVALEGLALAGIILALWFWVGLLLDFGVFKLTHFDWVQELPGWLRAGLLGLMLAVLAGVVLVKVVRRLLVEFRPSELALVLERKFPHVLGDRLITAVELADLDRAEQQGYSRAMIEQTVREATIQLQFVPVDQVFEWRRLRKLGLWCAGLTLGIFVLVGGVYSAATQTNPLTDFAVRFKDVATIWFERNVLLQNTIWPRNAYLELLDFPSSGDLRIGRDTPSTRLRVWSIKWLVADSAAPEGWRAMTWSDVTPDLSGGPVPALPGELAAAPSLDRVNLLLDQPEFSQKLRQEIGDEEFAALTQVFERLATRAAEPGMGRRLRLLDVPVRVEVSTWGEKTSNETPLARGNDQEYAGALTDLKESVRFRVRAGDYATPVRKITLVPPPMLTALGRNERRPAYLFHRPPVDGGAPALRGLKQSVSELAVSLSGAVSQFSVPVGTDVELYGTVDKKLARAAVIPVAKKDEAGAAPVELALDADLMGFRHRLPMVLTTQEFELEFTDADNVRSRRHVLIEPVKDVPPIVNVMIDGIRKTNNGYMVTPMAMIPFAGTVADSYGIAAVEYSLSLVRLETTGVIAAQTAWAAGAAAHFAPLNPVSLLAGSAAAGQVAKALIDTSPEPKLHRFALRTFEEIVREKAVRDVILTELRRRLESKPGDLPHVLQFEAKPKFEYLDLRDRLPDVKVKEDQLVQPRYRMKLGVEALDFNVETGPGVGTNKEPPFTVLIVSEAELLVEIANDERNLHFKMEDAVNRLKDARLRLDKVADQLPMLEPAQIGTMALRAQEIQDATLKARDATQEVLNEYSRLLREMELNRVMPKLVEKVKGEIIMPLEGALRLEFVQAEEAEEAFRKELEAGRKPSADPTKLALDRLIDRLSRVMDAMGEIKGINDLITALRAIEKGQEQDIGAVLRKIKKEKEEELLKKLGDLK